MARRSDHSREELFELILRAAETRVRDQGTAGLTARALARAIGYTPGTLYLVFDNLDDIIVHVNARTLDRLHTTMSNAVGKASTPTDGLKAIAGAYVDFARDEPNLWRLCFEHRLPEDRPGPAWLDERIERLVALVMAPLREAVRADEPTLITAAQSLWSGVHGICMLSQTHKLAMLGDQSTEQLADSLVTHYLAGLRAQPSVGA